MPSIYLIDSLKLDRNGLKVRDADNKWSPLHHSQGSLDGACEVYSTLMALLYIGIISAEDINPDTHINRRSKKGKFLSNLLNEQGMVRDGYTDKKMKKELDDAFDDLTTEIFKGDVPAIVSSLGEELDADHPVVLSVKGDNMCHAVLAVGTEYDSTDKRYKIFCLDPSFPLSEAAYWNCIIDTSRYNAGEFPFWYIPIDNNYMQKVTISSAMSIYIDEY